jgi:hypothetical protein
LTKFGIAFLVLLVLPAIFASESRRHAPGTLARGVASNQRLSALTGGVLYVLLLALGVTVLYIQGLLPLHFIVGFVLVPPLGLKLGSAGYRFIRYYTGDPTYRLAGPPSALLRLTAPVLVVSTVVAFGTGFELWLYGLGLGDVWVSAHNLSSVVMVLSGSVHVAGHLRLSATATARTVTAAVDGRWTATSWLVVASLSAGLVLGAASLLYASPFPTSFGG